MIIYPFNYLFSSGAYVHNVLKNNCTFATETGWKKKRWIETNRVNSKYNSSQVHKKNNVLCRWNKISKIIFFNLISLLYFSSHGNKWSIHVYIQCTNVIINNQIYSDIYNKWTINNKDQFMMNCWRFWESIKNFYKYI